ncbi:hypothetical protein L6452_43374 [Arctium lappa]|uniref:Uncharacterized protein n=1 Tax=Arctium lappa TaxID=4217 RepID=A0ACB8XM28_ARCLA|nr:hypothetical protein L6452_43374 [Arctium lappa]
MGDHDKNKKKKNGKSMPPLPINIGCLGIGGGIVLVGGALVTATLVVSAALAIKTRRQRRSSSDAINNTKKTVDAPNQLEDLMKSNESSQDFSLVMKEMQANKTNQILTPDETQNSGMDCDEKVDSGDGIFSVVGEDQESTLIYIDSVSETEQVDTGYEKVVLECGQQLVVATQTELGFPSSEEDSCSEISAITTARDGVGEEQKYPMFIDDSETDAAGIEKSLVSIEVVTLIKEYEVVQVEESMLYAKARDIASQGQLPIGDDVAEEIPIGHVVEDQQTIFMNEEVASVDRQFLEKKEKDGHDEMIPEKCDLIDETGYPKLIVNELVPREEAKIEVEDNLQVQFLEEKEIDGHDEIMVEDCEGDLSYKTGEIMRGEKQQMENNSKQVMGEEACVKPVNMEDVLGVAAALDAQEMQFPQTFSNGQHFSSTVDGTAVREGNTPRKLMNKEEKGKETAQEVEQMTTKDEFVHEQEKDREGELPHVQLIATAKVDVVREDNPPRQLMNTEDELVKKEGKSKEDGIPHVRSIEEAKDGEEDASEVSSDETGYSSMQEEVIPEAKISNHKTEENMTIVGEEQNDSDHNRIMKEGKSASNYRERFAKQAAAAASEPWNLKLWTWSLLASIWCICHCYSQLPFPEVSLVGSLLFIFILLGYRKHTKYLVKYE